MSGQTFRLAPRGVVRAAAWPLETLRVFGALDFGATLHGSAPPSQFVRDYEAATARESVALWEATFEDSRFMKALLLASPSAYLRTVRGADRRDGPRNRAFRLVEYTLYRYLARAVTQITPQGLWAGVTEVRLGAATRVERAAPLAQFTPDLRPFQRLVQALGEHADYLDRLPWRLNPTLERRADGGWIFLFRKRDGGLEQRELGFDPVLSPALEALAGAAPASLAELATMLAGSAGAAAWRRVLGELAAGGVLVGGLDLPGKFATAWDALEATATRLLPGHAAAWRAQLERLREDCSLLEAAAWSASATRFASLVAQPATRIAELAHALALPAPETENVVRCDLRLPWRLVIDRAQLADLGRALAEYDRRWQRGASAATAERSARRAAFAAGLGEGRSLFGAAVLAAGLALPGGISWPASGEIAEPAIAARLAAWEACLRRPGSATTLAADPVASELAPHGCWLAGLDAEGGVCAHGISDLPTIASARYGGVLALDRHHAWLGAALAHESRASGIGQIDYRAPFEANPNALASPSVLHEAIAPWSADPATRDLTGARLVADARGRPLLALRHDPRPRRVLAFATANLLAGDPLAEALLMTGWRDATGRAQHAIDIPLADEIAAPRFSPRVMLPGGALLCPRRTVLGAALAGLRERRGAARFWYWQQLAKEFGWPAALEVGGETGGWLSVPRDSPLAVDALCRGLRPDAAYLMVREAGTDAGLALPDGGRHRAELAIPFLRSATGAEA